MSSEKIRKRIIFHGWVQGVGFRYRAYYAAEAAGATGWVKNSFDGTVIMEIQGTEQQIDMVIAGINKGTFVNIERMDCTSLPLDPEERRFRIN